MELYPSTNNNIYNSRYLDTVKQDEYGRSKRMYEKAKHPFATGVVPLPAYSSMFQTANYNDSTTLSGEKMNKKDFTHNNMQPFLKGNITQNTNVESFTPRLDMATGVDKFYQKKTEVENIWKPTAGYNNIHGARPHSDYIKSRIEPSKLNNNVAPFEKVYVGPGLNKGYSSQGTGGFQQRDTLEYARPKTLDELRSKVNQKNAIYEIPFQAPAKGTDQRGMVQPYAKNKPEKTYNQTEDNWFKTTGTVLKDRSRPELAVKNTARPRTHVAYTGAAKLENMKGIAEADDYGKNNIIVYDNERNETQTRTVVSNITSTVKAVVSPVLDALKYTVKEYMVDAPRAGGNPRAQIPSKGEVIDDIMKTTVKETLVQDSENLNLSGPDGTYSALQDDAKTTVKETLIHDSDNLNLTGPDGTYSALQDDAKTTVKETLVHDGELLNIKNTPKAYARNEDKMKKTGKETLPVQDVVRNIGKGTYRVYMYDPDRVAKKTVKETTIKGTAELGFIGGIINSILGAYASTEIDIKNTNRQFTSDNEEYGIAKSMCDHRQTSREAEENAEIDGAKEQILIDAGHTPNPGGMNIPIDKSDVAMKTNKLLTDSYAAREAGNVNVIYQVGPQKDECAITRDHETNNAYENRLDGRILDSLKTNDFSININPI